MTPRTTALLLAAISPLLALAALARAEDPKNDLAGLDARLRAEEERRVAAIEKVKPAVVAVFAAGGQGGGSGVLIDEDGYALTNFHVVEGSGPIMKCGLADGILYDGVLVGLDKVGDVALIKLLPKKEGAKFPYAKLGDSDKVEPGDWSLAMGNPFLLATDFTPTVTFGLISGTHRYQYPAGTLLEYTDCIQIDTSINPGNSGGPLFNMDGELIGINGRGSFEKRGRVNSGVGYAISINQIKNFMGQLRAGMDTDHASLGAKIQSDVEDAALGKPKVKVMIDCDAERRGLQEDDEIVFFAGRRVMSDNEFKNVLGIYPRGWRVPMQYRRDNTRYNILVRLMGVQREEIPDASKPAPGPGPAPGPAPKAPPIPNSPATKFYKAKPGFANFYYNELARNNLLKEFKAKNGDFSSFTGDWTFRGNGLIKDQRGAALIAIKHKGAKDKVNDAILGTVGGIDQYLEPLKGNDLKPDDLKEPIGSGGLLVALYHYRLLLLGGIKGFDISHGGTEPYYLPQTGKGEPDYVKSRVEAEVLRTTYAGVTGKWYFSTDPKTPHQLLGFEILPDRDEDPCEVTLLEYKADGGISVPTKMVVRYGNNTFAEFNDLTIKMDKAN